MFIVRFFYRFFAGILPNLFKVVRAFRKKGGRLPFWIAVMDFLFVLRGMALFLLLNLAGLVFFFFLSQGTDLLTVIMEDSKENYAGSILWLLLGTFFWSVVAEFGARYLMNVVDNSGKILTDERVEWRKLLQTFFAKFFLFLPPLTVFFGLLKASMINYNFSFAGFFQSLKDVGITLLIFLVLLILIYYLYQDPKWINKTGRLLKFLRLAKANEADDELKWQGKLYGIYRDYIFMYPEAALPKNILPAKQTLEATEKETHEDEALLHFPQSEAILPRNRVPGQFIVRRFERPVDGDMWCRWIYKVPLSFFPRLHRQVAIIVFTGIAVILTVSLLPVPVYKNIGSPGLITFAFAAWLAVYIGLVFLDHANPFKFNPPWRMLIVCWMIVCSIINNDHPIRKNSTDAKAIDSRPLLRDHFHQWASRHPDDSIIIFVCAEGGAMRTGAFSSMILSRIQDIDSSFKNRIFAFSSVSGGSLGIGYFNALAYFHPHADPSAGPSYYKDRTKDFFGRDHLAPIIGKMFYGDLLNLFSPWMIPVFDRATVLEKSWEQGYRLNAVYNGNNNVFASDYFSVYHPADSVYYPAWFINTEEVETGLQGWVTNINPKTLPLSKDRDILKKVNGTIRYSTAINFSTRFPLFSPGGELEYQSQRYHYVDGGYIENYGAQTMLDVLQDLNKDSLFHRYKPYVMLIQFGNDSRIIPSNVKVANEFTEIVNGIYDSRAGRGKTAKYDLQNYVSALHGKFVDIPLDVRVAQVPLNWVLSDTSLNRLDHYCDKLIKENKDIKDVLQVMKYKRILPGP
ncbi:MAG: hypothetical protein ABI480_09090 [Chitinophagaceae bacterium]